MGGGGKGREGSSVQREWQVERKKWGGGGGTNRLRGMPWGARRNHCEGAEVKWSGTRPDSSIERSKCWTRFGENAFPEYRDVLAGEIFVEMNTKVREYVSTDHRLQQTCRIVQGCEL